MLSINLAGERKKEDWTNLGEERRSAARSGRIWDTRKKDAKKETKEKFVYELEVKIKANKSVREQCHNKTNTIGGWGGGEEREREGEGNKQETSQPHFQRPTLSLNTERRPHTSFPSEKNINKQPAQSKRNATAANTHVNVRRWIGTDFRSIYTPSTIVKLPGINIRCSRDISGVRIALTLAAVCFVLFRGSVSAWVVAQRYFFPLPSFCRVCDLNPLFPAMRAHWISTF